MAASIASLASFVYKRLSNPNLEMDPDQSIDQEQTKPKLTAVWRTKSTPEDLDTPPTTTRFKEDGSLLRLLRTKSMPVLGVDKGLILRRAKTINLNDMDSSRSSSSIQDTPPRYISTTLSEVGSDSSSNITMPNMQRSLSPSEQRKKLTRSVSDGHLMTKRKKSRKDVTEEFPTGTLPSVKKLKHKFDRRSEGELQQALEYQTPPKHKFAEYDTSDGAAVTKSERKHKVKKEVERRRASRHESLLEWEEDSPERPRESLYEIHLKSVKKLRQKFESSSASEADEVVFHTSTPKKPMSKSTEGLEKTVASDITPSAPTKTEDPTHKEENMERRARSLNKRDSKSARLRARSEPDMNTIRQMRSNKMPVSVKELKMKFEMQSSPESLTSETSPIPERAIYVIKNGGTSAVSPDKSYVNESMIKSVSSVETVTRDITTTVTQAGGVTVTETNITQQAVSPKVKSTKEEIAIPVINVEKNTEIETAKTEVIKKSEIKKLKSETKGEAVMQKETTMKNQAENVSTQSTSINESKKSYQSSEDSFTYTTPSVRSLRKRFELAPSAQSFSKTAGSDGGSKASQAISPGLSVSPMDIRSSSAGELESRKDGSQSSVQESHRYSLTSSSIKDLMRQFEIVSPEESTPQEDAKFSFEQEVTMNTKSKVLQRQKKVYKEETESSEISRSILTTSSASGSSRYKAEGESSSSSDDENLAMQEMKEDRVAREKWEIEEGEKKRKGEEERGEKERYERERAEKEKKEMAKRELKIKMEKEREKKEKLEREKEEKKRKEKEMERAEREKAERKRVEKEAMLIIEREKRQMKARKSSESFSSESDSERDKMKKEEVERERKEMEKRKEKEEQLKKEYERKKREKEEAERRERELEERERIKREREEQERQKREKEEEERKRKKKEEAEKRESEEKERKERIEHERKEMERLEKERKEKEKKEKEQSEKQKKEKEQKEMEERKQKERENKEQERREMTEKEQLEKKKERAEKERLEREKERAEKERLEREKERAEKERTERGKERKSSRDSSESSEDEAQKPKVNVHSLVDRFAKIQDFGGTNGSMKTESEDSSKIRSDSVRSDEVGKLINKFTNLKDVDLEQEAEKLNQDETEDRRFSDVAALVGKFAHIIERKHSSSSDSGNNSEGETKAKVTPAIPKISTKTNLGNTRTLKEDELKFFTSGNAGESFIRSQSLRVKKNAPPPFTQPRFGSMRETKSKPKSKYERQHSTSSSSENENHATTPKAPTPGASIKKTPGGTRTLKEDEMKFFTSGVDGENFMRTQSLRIKKNENPFTQPRFGSLRDKKTRAQELAELENKQRTPKNLPKNCRMLRPDEIQFFNSRNLNVYQSGRRSSKHKKLNSDGKQGFRLNSQSDQGGGLGSGDDHAASTDTDSDMGILRGCWSEEGEYRDEIHTDDLEMTLITYDNQPFSDPEDYLLDPEITPIQIKEKISRLAPVALDETGDEEFLAIDSQDKPDDNYELELRTEFMGEDKEKQSRETQKTEENIEIQTNLKYMNKTQVQQFLEVLEQDKEGNEIHESGRQSEENEHQTLMRENGRVIADQKAGDTSTDQERMDGDWVMLESYEKPGKYKSEVNIGLVIEGKKEEMSHKVNTREETRSFEVLDTYIKHQTPHSTENGSQFDNIGATGKSSHKSVSSGKYIEVSHKSSEENEKEREKKGGEGESIDKRVHENKEEMVERKERNEKEEKRKNNEAEGHGEAEKIGKENSNIKEKEKDREERSKKDDKNKKAEEQDSQKQAKFIQEQEDKKYLGVMIDKGSKDNKENVGDNDKDGRLTKIESDSESGDSDTDIGLLDAALIDIDQQDIGKDIMKSEKAGKLDTDEKIVREEIKRMESEELKTEKKIEKVEIKKTETKKTKGYEIEEEIMKKEIGKMEGAGEVKKTEEIKRTESEEWEERMKNLEGEIIPRTESDVWSVDSIEEIEDSPRRIGGKEMMREKELMVQNYMTMMHDLEFIAELSQLGQEMMAGGVKEEEEGEKFPAKNEEMIGDDVVMKKEARVTQQQGVKIEGNYGKEEERKVTKGKETEYPFKLHEETSEGGVKIRKSRKILTRQEKVDEVCSKMKQNITESQMNVEDDKRSKKGVVSDSYDSYVYIRRDSEMSDYNEMIKEDFVLICMMLAGLSAFVYYLYSFFS